MTGLQQSADGNKIPALRQASVVGRHPKQHPIHSLSIHDFADPTQVIFGTLRGHKTPTQSQSRWLSGQRAKNANAPRSHTTQWTQFL